MTVNIQPLNFSSFFIDDAPLTLAERQTLASSSKVETLGIKLVGEGEEQFLEAGVITQSVVVRPGFTFNEELQIPIEKINAPVPVVTYPFPVVDTLLEPRHFSSTEFKSETPAALGGSADNFKTPQSPVIPAPLFMGHSSGTGSGLPVDASTVETSAINQSAQLKRAAFDSINLGMAGFAIFAVIIAIAIFKR